MPGFDTNTKLLIQFNGEQGETTYTAETEHTVNFVGNAIIDASEKKFGSGSGLLDGIASCWTVSSHTDWNLFASNQDNKTFDCFLYPKNQEGVTQVILSRGTSSNDRYTLYYGGSNGINFRLRIGGTNVIDTGVAGVLTNNQWHHIALIKVATKYAVYINGIQVSYTDDSSTGSVSGNLFIGRHGFEGSGYLNGNIDQVRIQYSNYFNASPNVGLTDTITVPTEEYSKDYLIIPSQGIILI